MKVDIDKKLREAGFVIQNIDSFNPTASLGVILREAQTNTGPVYYLIFIDLVFLKQQFCLFLI